MGGEPWCFDSFQIAALTDYQIHHVYVLPAIQRTKREQRAMTPTTQTMTQTAADVVLTPGHVGPKVEELGQTVDEVTAFYKSMGLSEATARRMAEDQLTGE